MFFRLLLLFVVVPLLELSILAAISDRTGLMTTILLVLITGAIGAALAKRQGLRAWQKINEAMQQGKTPAAELVDGAMILVAAAVLITPGLLTDVFGFLLLIPRTRQFFSRLLGRWFMARTVVHFQSGSTGFRYAPGQQQPADPGSGGPVVIDAEFERIPDQPGNE